ncbi:MAG TPA: thiamine pyrophosphate-dependent enzyme [Terracidiphilus sp.]
MGNKSKGTGADEASVVPAEKNGFTLISNDKLLALYTNLLKIRMIATQQPLSNGRMGSLKGREAGTVGVTIDLGSEDIVSCAGHSLVPGFLKAASIETRLHALGTDGMQPRDSSAHSRNGAAERNGSRPTGSIQPMLHTVLGAALANKTGKNGNIAVVFNFDGENEAWNQAMQIATLHGLPIIFLNQPIGKPARAERTRTIDTSRNVTEIPYFPGITVDGHDVVAVYRVANEAISRARHGRGPTLIECKAFRLTSDKGTNGLVTHRRHALDSVVNMETYLRNKGLLDRKLKIEMLSEVANELNKSTRI